MRTFKISKMPFDDNRKLFPKTSFTLQDNSVTCFVGCNGSGKSTLIQEIKTNLQEGEAIDLTAKLNLFNDIFESKKSDSKDMYISYTKESGFTTTEQDSIASSMTQMISSTGEWIIDRLGRAAALIGQAVRKGGEDGRSLFILLDDCDAGTSIDVIGDIVNFINAVRKDCEQQGITYYICISTNAYELCRGFTCIDVSTFKELQFTTYEEYKKFVLASRKRKTEQLAKAAARRDDIF